MLCDLWDSCVSFSQILRMRFITMRSKSGRRVKSISLDLLFFQDDLLILSSMI